MQQLDTAVSCHEDLTQEDVIYSITMEADHRVPIAATIERCQEVSCTMSFGFWVSTQKPGKASKQHTNPDVYPLLWVPLEDDVAE